MIHPVQGAVLTLALVALGGCATKGDLRRVEEQLLLSRGENQRADSARGAQLAEVICFLASPAASGIHGALIPVRGLV